jgi:formate transporter
MAGSPNRSKSIERLTVTFDAILPRDMARRAEESGVARASTDPITLLILSILAGAFISFGAVFATTVSAGGTVLPFGLLRLLMGLVFSVGLILVVVGGAELFTGNNLIVMAWASGRVTTRAVATNWAVALTGNFIGAVLTACLMYLTTQYTFGGGAVGLAALNIASAKTSLAFIPALTLGIMCNALVCLTVWMCYGARTSVDRIITIVPPIAAFVASGFEHCIANMYFIPIGIFIRTGAPDAFWKAIEKSPADFSSLTWYNFFVTNLLPVTLGNIVGGSTMVGAIYWFLYLRRQKQL